MVKKLGILIAVFVIVGGTAAAAPTAMDSDRADNAYTFEWDADAGEITAAASSTVTTRDDKVSFWVYAFERPGAPKGKRLLGRIDLRLIKKESVAYDGRFTYVVRDSIGQVVKDSSRTRRIVLRPKKGKRAARLRLFYDLPSGKYTLDATFQG